MEDYKKYDMFKKAGMEDASVNALGVGDARIDERIIRAASGEAYNLNSESLIDAVYPDLPKSVRGPRNPYNDPDNEAYNALYWALSNIINDRVDFLARKGEIITVWESSFQIPAWITPGKLYQLQTFGLVEYIDDSWVATEEAEANYYRQHQPTFEPNEPDEPKVDLIDVILDNEGSK